MWVRVSDFLILLVLCFFISACSGNKPVKTYEGAALPDSEVAILMAPENINLLSVNGRPVTQYLLSNLETRYALKEGENLVVFQYKSIWGRAKADEQTGSRVDVAESAPKEVLIKAEPGKQYTFIYPAASHFKEASALAADFSAQIVDQNNERVSESVVQGTLSGLLKDTKPDPVVLDAKQLPVGADKVSQTISDQLKVLWSKASAEEKKSFLSWVFQE